MSDLHEVVVAELDRLERLYGGDRKDGRHAALVAAVQWLRWPWDPITRRPQCTACVVTSGAWVGLRQIAEALGIEASDGG